MPSYISYQLSAFGYQLSAMRYLLFGIWNLTFEIWHLTFDHQVYIVFKTPAPGRDRRNALACLCVVHAHADDVVTGSESSG